MWTLLISTTFAGVPSIDAPVKTGVRAENEAAVVIGIEDYFMLPDVPFAEADASAVYDFLVYTRGVPSAAVQVLDGSPVREKILKAAETAAQEAGPNGTVWVYFAGHGAASPTSGERVLLGADAQPDLDVFDARAVMVTELRQAATSAGGRAILLMDACYSGKGRDGADLIPGKRFAVPSYAASTAPTVLEWSAAGPGEWSGPLEGAGHGAFTYTVLGALRGWADGQLDGDPDGVVTAEEADLYVRDALKELQVRDQRPVMAVEDAGDWALSTGAETNPASKTAPAPAPTPAQTAVTSTPAPEGERQLLTESYKGILESAANMRDVCEDPTARDMLQILLTETEEMIRTADSDSITRAREKQPYVLLQVQQLATQCVSASHAQPVAAAPPASGSTSLELPDHMALGFGRPMDKRVAGCASYSRSHNAIKVFFPDGLPQGAPHDEEPMGWGCGFAHPDVFVYRGDDAQWRGVVAAWVASGHNETTFGAARWPAVAQKGEWTNWAVRAGNFVYAFTCNARCAMSKKTEAFIAATSAVP